jgi:gluconokinase
MGVTGSGKSLIGEKLAKKLNFDFIDADQYHTQLNKAKMSQGIPLTDEDRIPWLNDLANMIKVRTKKGKNVIIACSALKNAYRKLLLDAFEQSYILYLQGGYDLIANRLANRKHEFMNSSLLPSQFQILEEPGYSILCI